MPKAVQPSASRGSRKADGRKELSPLMTIAIIGAAVLLLGGGLWWWSSRANLGGITGPMPSGADKLQTTDKDIDDLRTMLSHRGERMRQQRGKQGQIPAAPAGNL